MSNVEYAYLHFCSPPCVRVEDAWKYLYRVADKAGATVDFLLTAKRDRKTAVLRFLRNAVAMVSDNAACDADVEIRQVKYLNIRKEPLRSTENCVQSRGSNRTSESSIRCFIIAR